MADREIIIREKLTHEGIFDFSALYSYAHAWFQEEQYNGVDEERYSEKVSGNKRNLLIDWIATKNYLIKTDFMSCTKWNLKSRFPWMFFCPPSRSLKELIKMFLGSMVYPIGRKSNRGE